MLVRFLLVALVALSAVGCARGASVRDRILATKSPLIGDAYSYEDGTFSVARVHVALLPRTTEAEAATFWCEVVVPAGGTHDGDGVMVTLAIQGVGGSVADDTACEAD